MSQREDEAYKQFLEEVKAKLPTELQSNLDAIAGTEAGRELFRGGLRTSDYYKRLETLNTEKQQIQETAARQKAWFDQAEPKVKRSVQEAEKLKAKLRALEDKAADAGFDLDDVGEPKRGNGAPVAADSSFADELKELRGKVDFYDKALPRVLGELTGIVKDSIRDNYDVDPIEVIRYSTERGVNPRTAFEQMTSEVREQRAQKALEEELDKAREEGRKEALSKLQGPDRIRPAGPSIVDALQVKDAPAVGHNERVRDAVKDFMELGG